MSFIEANNVIKNRIIYKLDQCIISLDDIVGLGPCMEIETCLEEGDKYKKELKERLTYSKKLGISDGFERTSYLELLELNKKSSEKIE